MKRTVLAGIALVVAAVMVGCTRAQHDQSTSTPAVVPSASAVAEADLNRISSAMNSQSPDTQASVLLPDLAKLTKGQALLPAGAKLTVVPGTAVCRGVSCEVDATITDSSGAVQTYVLYLDNSTGMWLITAVDKKE